LTSPATARHEESSWVNSESCTEKAVRESWLPEPSNVANRVSKEFS